MEVAEKMLCLCCVVSVLFRIYIWKYSLCCEWVISIAWQLVWSHFHRDCYDALSMRAYPIAIKKNNSSPNLWELIILMRNKTIYGIIHHRKRAPTTTIIEAIGFLVILSGKQRKGKKKKENCEQNNTQDEWNLSFRLHEYADWRQATTKNEMKKRTHSKENSTVWEKTNIEFCCVRCRRIGTPPFPTTMPLQWSFLICAAWENVAIACNECYNWDR